MWEYMLRFSHMIQEKAKKKAQILAFWEKHGLEATIDAYQAKERTLYAWKQKLKANGGKIDSLNDKDKTPKNKRKRVIDPAIEQFIIQIRKEHPGLGKEKINSFLKEENIAGISDSTVGRILKELKEKGKIPKRAKLSLYGKTGALKDRKPIIKRKKKRIKDYKPDKEGDLLQLDTIVKFINGIKRYTVTAIDIKSDFAFAYSYTTPSSKNTKDFFQKLEYVAPFAIKNIQTDNGSEFEKYFRDHIEQNNITHFHNYPKCPKMNAYIERFNRTIQEEFMDYNISVLADDINGFNHKMTDWLLWYNTKRPHWSLGLISPMRFIINSYKPENCNMLWTDTPGL